MEILELIMPFLNPGSKFPRTRVRKGIIRSQLPHFRDFKRSIFLFPAISSSIIKNNEKIVRKDLIESNRQDYNLAFVFIKVCLRDSERVFLHHFGS